MSTPVTPANPLPTLQGIPSNPAPKAMNGIRLCVVVAHQSMHMCTWRALCIDNPVDVESRGTLAILIQECSVGTTSP